MSCLKQNIIQKYIDGEASLKEAEVVEKHLAKCADCKQRLEQQMHLSETVRSAMNLLIQEAVQIPDWSKPVQKTYRLKPAMISIISAACVLVFVFFLTHTREPINTARVAIVPEVNANKPASEQELIIQIVDDKGKITEYDLK